MERPLVSSEGYSEILAPNAFRSLIHIQAEYVSRHQLIASFSRPLTGSMLRRGPLEPVWELIEPRRDHLAVVLDPLGNVASWHIGAKASMGHEAHEIIGNHVSRLYPAEAIEGGWPELELNVAAVQGRFESRA